MSTGPWRHPPIVAVMAFEAICGLKSEVDVTYHAPFKVPNSAGAVDTFWLIDFEFACPM